MSQHPTELLSAYADGELPPASRLEVATHLLECRACARLMQEILAIDAAARGLDVEAPEGYFDDFGARVRARLHTRRRGAIPWWWAAAAAALLVGVMTPIILHQPQLQAPAAAPAPAAEAQAPAGSASAPEPAKADQDATAPAATTPQPPAKKEKDELGPPQDKAREAAGGGLEEKAPRAKALEAPRAPLPVPATTARDPFAKAPLGDAEERRDGTLQSEPTAQQPALSEEARGIAPPPAPAPQGAAAANTDSRDQPGRRAASGTLAKTQADARDRARFTELASEHVASAGEARSLREAWREFARRYPDSPLADEARVRVISSGLDAYQQGGDARDLSQLRRDTATYLERKDAAQAERVRALLESVR